MTARTPLERFQQKYVLSPTGCWLWTAAKDRKGYGHFRYGGKTRLAHRVSYELRVGPIPDGLQLDHLCRVHNCVNPKHLEPVTCRENLMRGDTVNARNAAKTHCSNGHEFNEKNTYVYPDGRRHCRACNAANMRRASARRRMAGLAA